MKNYFLLLTLTFLISCYSVKAPSVWTGMSIQEFKKNSKHEELAAMNETWTIYQVIYGMNGQNIKFYYFKDGKLNHMDSGEKAVDLRIKID